ncbi:hypothetical protein Tco_1516201 [Tanacetum coccineum]
MNCTVKLRRRDAAYLQTQLWITQKEEAQTSTSGTQNDKALVLDSNGSSEYTESLEPITKPHPDRQDTNNVIIAEPSVEHNRGIVEKYPATVEETLRRFSCDGSLRGDCGLGFGVGKLTSTSLEELQWFNFFLHMGLTDILATLQGLGEGLRGEDIGEDKMNVVIVFKEEG